MTGSEAYKQILRRPKHKAMAWKATCFILTAARPLTLLEMNIALNASDKARSFEQLDVEDEDSFKDSLRSWCGLFVSVHHDNVYLLHQTAREFLLTDSSVSPTLSLSTLEWYHSISIQEAHEALGEACVLYLNIFNSDTNSPTKDFRGCKSCQAYAFLHYSATIWADHLSEAGID